jgi:hypothetical protein
MTKFAQSIPKQGILLLHTSILPNQVIYTIQASKYTSTKLLQSLQNAKLIHTVEQFIHLGRGDISHAQLKKSTDATNFTYNIPKNI